MEFYDHVNAMIDTMIADYKAANADGRLTFKEMLTLVYNASASFVKLVETAKLNSGPEKKTVVLSAIEKFYDTVVAPIDITGIPNVVEGLVDTAIKTLILTLASAWIDSLVTIFNRIGWGDTSAERLQSPVMF